MKLTYKPRTPKAIKDYSVYADGTLIGTVCLRGTGWRAMTSEILSPAYPTRAEAVDELLNKLNLA